MQRTYKSKKETGGGVDPRDMLFTLDDKTSAFDAFYIQNIKQTKRELSCMGTSKQYNRAANRVRKRKYVKRIVKEVEPPIPESLSRSTYLTPDKSIHVNRGADLFDQLLNSSSQQEHPASKSSNDLFVKLCLSVEKKMNVKKTKKKPNKACIKKFNCSSSESSDSDKENNGKLPVQNMTNILKHDLLIEVQPKISPKSQDESINHMINNLSLITKMIKRNSPKDSLRRSPRLRTNRLTKNLQSAQDSPQCSTPFTEKYRSKSIYNFSPIHMGNLNESNVENYEQKPDKTADFDDINQVPERSDDIVHSPVLKCLSKGSVSSNSSSRSNNSQTKKCSKDNMKDSYIPETERLGKETVVQQEKSSEVSVYEDSADNTPFLGFSLNALKGTSICKALDEAENIDSSLQKLPNKKSIVLQSNIYSRSLNEPKEKRLKSNSLEKVTEECHDSSNDYEASVITENEVQVSVEIKPFIGFSDTTAKNTEDILKYYEKINQSCENSVTEVTMVESTDLQHDKKTDRNRADTDSSEKLSLHSESKITQEIENESCDTNDDKKSSYDTCSNLEYNTSLDNGDVLEIKESIIVLDKLSDSTFKKYYENVVEIYSSSSNNNSSFDESQTGEADESLNEDEILYKESSHGHSIEFEENDTVVYQNKSHHSETNETLYKIASWKDSIDCEGNITVADNSNENETFSSIENSSSDESRQSSDNETLYKGSSDDDSIYENASTIVHRNQIETSSASSKSTNKLKCNASPNGSYNDEYSIFDEENTSVINYKDKSTAGTSIAQLNSSEEVTDSPRYDEEERINFVTTRRRNEIAKKSLLMILDDSGSASSSDCDKTVLSNNCNSEYKDTDDQENSKEKAILSKVSLPKYTEHDSKSITMRRGSKKCLNSTQLEESNLDCSTMKQAIVLQPGKKWERSLSIYRRMTILNNFNGSILDDEDCMKKGRNYRQSVLNTMELQEQIGPLHNDSFSSFRSSIAPKPQRSTIRIVKEPSSSRVSLCTTTVFDDLTGFLAEECDDTLIELSKLSIADSDHDITVVEKVHDTSGRITTAQDYVLRRCDQTAPILFDECYPETILKNCRKIGEGVYGEVFLWRARDGPRVMKVVPVAGACRVNGERQKDYHEIIAEIVIAMELSALRAPIAAIERHFDEGLDADSLELHSIENATDAFNEVKAVRCVYGNYPSRLLDLWELFDETSGSENDNPAVLPPDQQFIVLELANAGQDLESYTFNSAEQAYALFLQVAFALAVGEESLQFEHRDLHWGNVLIAPTEQKFATFVLDGRVHRIPRRGVAASVIDYSLSRVSLPLGGGGGESAALYNELASDEALFDAVGDYQFEVYRLMRDKLQNDWKTFEPYTNVLWLHYIADKMITALRYRRTNTKLHKLHIAKLRALRERILDHTSAKHLLTTYNEL